MPDGKRPARGRASRAAAPKPQRRAAAGRRPARRAYHHGDLRRALIAAGEEELAENGLDGFSLRGCARRAGVSHAAPAHHFRDARALLTALTAIGFARFTEKMRARMDKAGADPRARFAASGLGYVEFALEFPALFRLMFASDIPDREDFELRSAADESFSVLLDAVGAVYGQDPRENQELMIPVTGAWSIVHGLANLMLSGRLVPIASLPPREKERAILRIVEITLP